MKGFFMKIISALIGGGASGSLGGFTASRNRGGSYLRARTMPVQPNTVNQIGIRAGMSNLVEVWKSDMSVAERQAWADYANTCPRSDTLGRVYYLTGLQMFVACNQLRLQAGVAYLTVAPSEAGAVGEDNSVVFSAGAAANKLHVAYDNTQAWANEVGGYMLVYCSRSVSPARVFYKGPYQYWGKISGAAIPPVSPADFIKDFGISAGMSLHAKVVIIRADGRISPPFRGSCVAGA
jgi:hypothetical protein